MNINCNREQQLAIDIMPGGPEFVGPKMIEVNVGDHVVYGGRWMYVYAVNGRQLGLKTEARARKLYVGDLGKVRQVATNWR